MNFFSKQRLSIMILGVCLGLGFAFLSSFFISTSIPRDVLINLSAGMITIAFTVVIVQFLLASERKIKNKDAAQLASAELNTVAFILLIPITKMYGVKLDSVMEMPSAVKIVLDKVKKVDFKSENPKSSAVSSEDFSFALERSVASFDRILDYYSYALPAELKGVILKLRENSLSNLSLVNVHGKDSVGKRSNLMLVMSLYIGMFSDIKKLINYTQDL